MVGLYYSASILAGRASAPFVLPPCRHAHMHPDHMAAVGDIV